MIDYILGHINYWIIVVLMMIGLYTMMSKPNLIKKMAGMSVFQTGVIMLYISMGKIENGTAPIVAEGYDIYANPLPQVLMLTAIVVGVATTALGFALIVRIKEAYGTLEEDEIAAMDDET